MLRSIALCCLIGLHASVLFADDPKAVPKSEEDLFRSRSLGFSINPPAMPKETDQPGNVAFFFLPPKDGFAPNVGVLLQRYGGTMKQYAELSERQLNTAGHTIAHKDVTNGVFTIEYSGTANSRKLHWYLKAYKSGERIYVITATAPESEWAKLQKTMKQSVDSFVLEKK